MSIFDIFKRKSSTNFSGNNSKGSNNIFEGPTFLDSCTVPIDNMGKYLKFEWKRKLQSLSGGNKFRIRYYGQQHRSFAGLLIAKEFAPLLVVAVDVITDREILLFDGCKHGYNAMFCDIYTKDQIENRVTENLYVDKNGNEVFQISLSIS